MAEQRKKEKKPAPAQGKAPRKAVSTNMRIATTTSRIALVMLIAGSIIARLLGNDTVLLVAIAAIFVVAFFALMYAAIKKDQEEKWKAAGKANEPDQGMDDDVQ